ncbi:unnamed protein product, partial [Choristocarpus tenellus]
MQYNMVTAATDDHLNLIATVSCTLGKFGPSSGIHVWDYEMCSLLGTCLFPSVQLTRSTYSAAAAFGIGGGDSSGGQESNIGRENKLCGAVGDRGGGRSMTTHITSLVFLTPRPVLAGASSSGVVALWSVPDC